MSCPANKYGRTVDKTCHTCTAPCYNCTTPDGPSICTACLAPNYLEVNTCNTTCPIGKYGSTLDQTCKICAYPCAVILLKKF